MTITDIKKKMVTISIVFNIFQMKRGGKEVIKEYRNRCIYGFHTEGEESAEEITLKEY